MKKALYLCVLVRLHNLSSHCEEKYMAVVYALYLDLSVRKEDIKIPRLKKCSITNR